MSAAVPPPHGPDGDASAIQRGRAEPTPALVRRRPLVERRVLLFLRGEADGLGHWDTADDFPDNQADRRCHVAAFALLRGLAARNALKVQAPSAPFVREDELQLLSWIARAQRVRGMEDDFHEDTRLTRSIFLCAGILTGLGICLPAVTMLAGNGPLPRSGGTYP